MKDWDCGVRPLAGHRVLLVTPGCPALAGLGDGLSGLGADCREVFAAEDCAALAPLEAAFARSEAELGGLDALVIAVGSALSREPRPLTGFSPEQWRDACLVPLRTTRQCLQAAWRTLAGRAARIVLLGPNLALTGASGLTALSALGEGQRGLMKSAARQWGGQGIQLNWLGLDARVFARELDAQALARSPEMGDPAPALGRTPDLSWGVAESLALLIGAHAFTGASLPVDGGFWMVP
ncbi:SDR family oxidoreductase [Pseudomonas sp. NyZ201]|uniref:SDR family oxidoreductase n=1 Tax=Pseudomonas sp. NyZ201 TaxID=3409857 RepID=UPI003CE96430